MSVRRTPPAELLDVLLRHGIAFAEAGVLCAALRLTAAGRTAGATGQLFADLQREYERRRAVNTPRWMTEGGE